MNRVLEATLKEKVDNYDVSINTDDVGKAIDVYISCMRKLRDKYNIGHLEMDGLEAAVSEFGGYTQAAAYEAGFKDGFNLVLDMKKASN